MNNSAVAASAPAAVHATEAKARLCAAARVNAAAETHGRLTRLFIANTSRSIARLAAADRITPDINASASGSGVNGCFVAARHLARLLVTDPSNNAASTNPTAAATAATTATMNVKTKHSEAVCARVCVRSGVLQLLTVSFWLAARQLARRAQLRSAEVAVPPKTPSDSGKLNGNVHTNSCDVSDDDQDDSDYFSDHDDDDTDCDFETSMNTVRTSSSGVVSRVRASLPGVSQFLYHTAVPVLSRALTLSAALDSWMPTTTGSGSLSTRLDLTPNIKSSVKTKAAAVDAALLSLTQQFTTNAHITCPCPCACHNSINNIISSSSVNAHSSSPDSSFSCRDDCGFACSCGVVHVSVAFQQPPASERVHSQSQPLLSQSSSSQLSSSSQSLMVRSRSVVVDALFPTNPMNSNVRSSASVNNDDARVDALKTTAIRLRLHLNTDKNSDTDNSNDSDTNVINSNGSNNSSTSKNSSTNTQSVNAMTSARALASRLYPASPASSLRGGRVATATVSSLALACTHYLPSLPLRVRLYFDIASPALTNSNNNGGIKIDSDLDTAALSDRGRSLATDSQLLPLLQQRYPATLSAAATADALLLPALAIAHSGAVAAVAGSEALANAIALAWDRARLYRGKIIRNSNNNNNSNNSTSENTSNTTNAGHVNSSFANTAGFGSHTTSGSSSAASGLSLLSASPASAARLVGLGRSLAKDSTLRAALGTINIHVY